MAGVCRSECQFHAAPKTYSAWSGYCKTCERWVLISPGFRRCPCCHNRVRRHARNTPKAGVSFF